MPPFQGNSIYMQNGEAVIPPGTIADRLAQGNFGPVPNQSAPPGFQIPRTLTPEQLANALGGQAPPPPQAPAAAPQPPFQQQMQSFINQNAIRPPDIYTNSFPTPFGWATPGAM